MGVGLYLNALARPTAVDALSRKAIKKNLRGAGAIIGWRGLVAASRCMPLKQYQGLLRFLKAVSDYVKVDFKVELPSLSIILSPKEPIDFESLASQNHVEQIVKEFFNDRNHTLDLEYLPAYLRRARNTGS